MELDIVVPPGTLGSHREHVCADVDAGDQAIAADHLEQFGDVEARAAAHVKHAVSSFGAQRSANQLAPTQNVSRRVELL